MYQTPASYFFRLHHVRPRFKNDIENVLIFMATEISKIGRKPSDDFKDLINAEIRKFPGNLTRTEKTINNWRTEISALFGFMLKDEYGFTSPGLRALELADKQDLIEAFKKFLFFFQYPGGHLKSHENKSIIEQGIKFQPARAILELLSYAEKTEGRRIGINKAELTHCVFNDLRCTRDHEDIAATWSRLKKNKENEEQYDWTGDVIRYAGDILDYMEIANLLVSHGSDFYLNHREDIAISKFRTQSPSFTCYDTMISNRSPNMSLINECYSEWVAYVNQKIDDDFFETDVIALISANEEEYQALKKAAYESFEETVEKAEARTHEVGEWGEALVHGHECMRVKLGGRSDLVHLIKRIPTQFAVGYDIQSLELDTRKRLIEVKTTISSKPIEFNKFHLTPNEWSSAESYRDRYYVYRLFLSKQSKKLFVLADPVGLYKADQLQINIRSGADVIFDPKTCGQFEELLEWTS